MKKLRWALVILGGLVAAWFAKQTVTSKREKQLGKARQQRERLEDEQLDLEAAKGRNRADREAAEAAEAEVKERVERDRKAIEDENPDDPDAVNRLLAGIRVSRRRRRAT